MPENSRSHTEEDSPSKNINQQMMMDMYSRLVTLDWHHYSGYSSSNRSIDKIVWNDDESNEWTICAVPNPTDVTPFSPFILILECKYPRPENRFLKWKDAERYHITISQDGNTVFSKFNRTAQNYINKDLEGENVDNTQFILNALQILHTQVDIFFPKIIEEKDEVYKLKKRYYQIEIERLLERLTNVNHLAQSRMILPGVAIKQDLEISDSPLISYETDDFVFLSPFCNYGDRLKHVNVQDKRTNDLYVFQTLQVNIFSDHAFVLEEGEIGDIDTVNSFACRFIAQTVRLSDQIDRIIPDDSLVVVDSSKDVAGVDRLLELSKKEKISFANAIEVLESCWSLTDPKISIFDEDVWQAFDIFGKFIAQQIVTQEEMDLWLLDHFKTSVFLVLQNIWDDNFRQLPTIHPGTKTKNAYEFEKNRVYEQWHGIIEYLKIEIKNRFDLVTSWHQYPSLMQKQAHELFDNLNDKWNGRIKLSGEFEERYVTQVLNGKSDIDYKEHSFILCLGGGADRSPEGYPPGARYLAAQGWNVINIDMGGNDPKIALQDTFPHLRLKLTPNTDLPLLLSRIGLSRPVGVICFSNFIDMNKSPSLEYKDAYALRERVEIWSKQFENQQGFPSYYNFHFLA